MSKILAQKEISSDLVKDVVIRENHYRGTSA